MKTFTVGVLVASLSLLGMEAVAQQRPAPRESAAAASTMPASAIESSKLIGARIKNAAGKDMGEIDALIVNPMDGKISHVVIGKGGMAGVGETKVLMPWSDLKIRTEKDRVVVNVDQAALDSAPKYDKRHSATQSAPAASPRTEEKKKY
ncbi:MAG TPA: PRC-barrel domain-containing protein [Methylomirabilota bacterium]|jgi:sporulation protein YlmC with PRC-barrel domain